jgi:hypothetical protein
VGADRAESNILIRMQIYKHGFVKLKKKWQEEHIAVGCTFPVVTQADNISHATPQSVTSDGWVPWNTGDSKRA